MHARPGTARAARTLAACAAVLLAADARGDTTAPSAAQAAAVAAAHKAWAAADTQQDGEKAAKLMAAQGMAILDGGDRILSRDEVAAFISGGGGGGGGGQHGKQSGGDQQHMQQLPTHSGDMRPTEFRALATIAQNISAAGGGPAQMVLHAGGRNDADGSLFYTRLVPAGTHSGAQAETWALETVLVPTADMAAAGPDAPETPAWLQAALHDMMRLAAMSEYTRAVEMYFADDAVALALRADGFATTKRDIVGTLRQMVPQSVFMGPHRFRVVAAREAEGGRVHHVLADRVNTALGLVHRCYLRWEAAAGSAGAGNDNKKQKDMKIAVMTPVGIGCDGEPCETAASILPMGTLEAAAGEMGDVLRRAFHIGSDLAHEISDLAHEVDDALAEAMKQLEGHAGSAAARAAVLEKYATAINGGQYQAAAQVHAKGGCVVPYGGGRLLAAGGDELPAYLKAMHEGGQGGSGSGSGKGGGDVELAQHRMTVRFDGGAFHTVGVNGADGSVYYIRWARGADAAGSGQSQSDTWGIATMAWGIGGGPASAGKGGGSTAKNSAGSQGPAWLAGRMAEIAKQYNAGTRGNLTALYTSDAVVVPLDVSGRHLEMLGRGEVAEYFGSVHKALDGAVELEIVDAMSEKVAPGMEAGKDVEIWHVLGRATVKASGYAGEFYMRWAQEDGEWRVQTELVRVGAKAGQAQQQQQQQQQQHSQKKD